MKLKQCVKGSASRFPSLLESEPSDPKEPEDDGRSSSDSSEPVTELLSRELSQAAQVSESIAGRTGLEAVQAAYLPMVTVAWVYGHRWGLLVFVGLSWRTQVA